MLKPNEHYRAVSWWVTWDDLLWPDKDAEDKVKRRADAMAENGCNAAVFFGFHFRWDYMPVWGRVHDYIATVARELHERDCMLFDHYSSVLTHRPRTKEEAWDIWQRNRHHVPFYPHPREAASWTFEGKRMNDWRMVDVETREPCWMASYTCEQYCMNNPDFVEAYQTYVNRLIEETQIDGLMSDDGIFYPGWRACACEHCLARFRTEYGRELPPTGDTSFWGNRGSEAFKDWIALRFQSVGDFLGTTKAVVPKDFPLMTCCSSSDSWNAPQVAMTYQDFIDHANIIMLEMCGSTPALNGRWDSRVSSQLLHLGIARDHDVPCFGLGYGFFEDTGFFVWALNKFLGSDTWFSTLKGRLGLRPAETAHLADDPDLVGEGYCFERDNPTLFTGRAETPVAVLFSRATRDYYGQNPQDYTLDYMQTCNLLMSAGVPFGVVTAVPFNASDWPVLVLSSAVCLSNDERARLDAYLEAGGTVIAAGPTGLRDERANPTEKDWLAGYGIAVSLDEPERGGVYPPSSGLKPETSTCTATFDGQELPPADWCTLDVGKGTLHWRPARVQHAQDNAGLAQRAAEAIPEAERIVASRPAGWFVRVHRDGNRLLVHGLPEQVGIQTSGTLYNHFNKQEIAEHIDYPAPPSEPLVLNVPPGATVLLHSPDLDAPIEQQAEEGTRVKVDLSAVRRYFIVEVTGRDG